MKFRIQFRMSLLVLRNSSGVRSPLVCPESLIWCLSHKRFGVQSRSLRRRLQEADLISPLMYHEPEFEKKPCNSLTISTYLHLSFVDADVHFVLCSPCPQKGAIDGVATWE